MKAKQLWIFLIIGGLVLCNCSAPQSVISGVVIDNNGPVAGAVVRIQNSEISTISGGDGTFALPSLSSEDPVTITAWASGYYIVAAEEIANPGTSDIEIVLVKHADYDESDYEWISAFTSANDPSNCQNCHSQPDDPSSRLPFDEWQNDAHANSFSSPRYLTMYTGTDISGNQSPPTRKGYNRDYGHFPLPPDRTRPYFGPGYQLDFPGTAGNCAACHAPGAAIDLPYNIDPTHLDDIGTEGITCDFCHKVWDVRFDESGLPYPNMPGVLSFEFRRPAEGHQFFAGPYDDVAPGEDTFSPLQKESQYCAPCHFGVFWDTLIYNSFGEWFESPYSDPVSGQTCQDCHMPAGFTDHFARLEEGGLVRDPMTIFSHLMPGAADEGFLKNAVKVFADAGRNGDAITVTVEIFNNNTGHHIPTDSPLRHMILLVEVTDSRGNQLAQIDGPTIPEWGGVGDPTQGYYSGLPGTAYAKILQELWTEVSPSGSYWNPTRIVSDNRIAAMDSDTTTYTFLAPDRGEVVIGVRLIFRRAFIELMDQKGWDVPDIQMAYESIRLTHEE